MHKLSLIFKPDSYSFNYKVFSIIKMQIIYDVIMVLLLTLLVVVSVILITFPEETYWVIKSLFYKDIRPGKQPKLWARLIGVVIMFISCTLIFYLISINPMFM